MAFGVVEDAPSDEHLRVNVMGQKKKLTVSFHFLIITFPMVCTVELATTNQ